MSRVFSVERAVDIRPEVFYSHAYRKRLGVYCVSAIEQHTVGISRAMPGRKNKSRTEHLTLCGESRKRSVLIFLYSVKTAPVYHLAAKSLDVTEHSVDHLHQLIRAYMRLCGGEYLLGRAKIAKAPQNVGYLRIVYPCHQLSVRECSRAPCAELDIRFAVKLTVKHEIVIDGASFFNAIASVDNDRAVSVLCQHKRGKKTRWTHSDDQRTARHSLASKRRCYLLVKYRLYIVSRHFLRICAKFFVAIRRDRIHKLYIILFSGVYAFLIHTKMKPCRVYPCTLYL